MDEYIDMRLMNVINCAKAWRRARDRGDKAKAILHLMRLGRAVDVLDTCDAIQVQGAASAKRLLKSLTKPPLRMIRGGK